MRMFLVSSNPQESHGNPHKLSPEGVFLMERIAEMFRRIQELRDALFDRQYRSGSSGSPMPPDAAAEICDKLREAELALGACWLALDPLKDLEARSSLAAARSCITAAGFLLPAPHSSAAAAA